MSSSPSRGFSSRPGYPPDRTGERLGVEGFQGVENDAVMDTRRGHCQV